MRLQINYLLIFFISLALFQFLYPENITLPNPKFDQAKANFKTISQIIFKLGQSKVPNPYSKDIDAINQKFNGKEITDKDIEAILSKLNKIKSGLLALDQNTKVTIPAGFAKSVEKTLGNFLSTSYTKLRSDLKDILQSTKKISEIITDEKGITLIKDSFIPIFWGFFNLYEHPYYKYLGTVRRLLHSDLNKDKLILIKDIMELLLIELNDENQNQTMTLEVRSGQRFNLNMRDFKELIKKYISNVNALIK